MIYKVLRAEFVERGEGPTSYFVIRAVRSNSNRTFFSGYIVRMRPDSDVWIAAARLKRGNAPFTAKGDLETVKAAVETQFNAS